MLSGVGKVSEQVLVTPVDSSTLHCLAVREVSPLASFSSEQTAESRSSSILAITLN